ncbi:LacI family DNA-binding transcriptional regulator [Clostridioides difficile]
MSSIKDVAKLAGVGVATVSRVLNGSKNVSDELKLRVNKAVEELGYSANSIAKGLKSSKTNNIAIIIPYIKRIFFTDIIDGISMVCKRKGYSIQIYESNDDEVTEMKLINSLVDTWIDGIIVASCINEKNEKTSEFIESLHLLNKKGVNIPIVNLEISALNDNISSVIVDHKKAAKEAVEHLISLDRKNIVHLAHPKESRIGKERLDGYIEALNENNILVDENLIAYGNYSVISGYKAVKSLIDNNIKFDAIFAANDQMAIGALKVCKAFNIQVPEQVAIVGYDDIFVTTLVEPAISTIKVFRAEMGISAANRLIDLIDNNGVLKDGEKIVILETKLIVRKSTDLNAKDAISNFYW